MFEKNQIIAASNRTAISKVHYFGLIDCTILWIRGIKLVLQFLDKLAIQVSMIRCSSRKKGCVHMML